MVARLDVGCDGGGTETDEAKTLAANVESVVATGAEGVTRVNHDDDIGAAGLANGNEDTDDDVNGAGGLAGVATTFELGSTCNELETDCEESMTNG